MIDLKVSLQSSSDRRTKTLGPNNRPWVGSRRSCTNGRTAPVMTSTEVTTVIETRSTTKRGVIGNHGLVCP